MGDIKSIIQPRYILFVVVAFLAAVLISGLAVGLILYYQRASDTRETVLSPYYARLRVSKAGGQQLHWNPVFTDQNASQTKQSMEFVEFYLSQGLQPASQLVQSVKVNKFSQDQFARLVGAENRGVLVTFRLEINVTDQRRDYDFEEKVRDEMLYALNAYQHMEVDLEEFEIQDSPLLQPRFYQSFESYLASGDPGLDLARVELLGLVYPTDAELGNVTCPPIEQPQHGSIFPLGCTLANFSRLTDTCRFNCGINHTLIGTDVVSCLSTERWSDSLPICKGQCLPLIKILGVEITPSSCLESPSLANSRCYYYCNPGFVLDGTPSRVCNPSGVWSGGTPMCKRTCAALSVPDSGHVWPRSCTSDPLIPGGTTCSFTCREGHTLSGSPSLYCDMDGSWNFPTPTCRRGCVPLLAPAFGEVFPPVCSYHVIKNGKRSVVMEGVVCDHSCNDGYRLDGSPQRMCGAGGIWTGTEAYCSRLCPPLKLPRLMLSTPPFCTSAKDSLKIAEGLKCHLSCPSSYKASDDNLVASCLSNGTWSPIPEKCLRICPAQSRVQNGDIKPDNCLSGQILTEGMSCTVLCSSGFTLRGATTITCQTNGKWTSATAQCLKRCPRLVAPAHGSLLPGNCSVSSLFQGEECQYQCDTDYGLVGLEYRICLTDGTWSSHEPSCIVERQFVIRQTSADHDICLDVNRVTYYVEKKSISDCTLKNRLQRWTLLNGGLIRNVGLRQCLAAEHVQAGSFIRIKECNTNDEKQVWSWEDDFGLSVILEGTDLQLGYGYVGLGKVMLMDRTKVGLMPWYALTGGGQVQSLYDVFSQEYCQRLRAPQFTYVTPTACTENQTLSNDTICEFSCWPERKLSGDSQRGCDGGRWNGSYPTCELACPPLYHPPEGNGSVTNSCTSGLQSDGTICEYKCNQASYSLVGESHTICLGSGNWSYPMPECIVHCPNISSVSSGVIYPADCTTAYKRIGSICQLSCEFPYMAKASVSATCEPSGNWSMTDFSCERGCSDPLPPVGEGGNVTCNSTELWENDQCTYTCGPDSHRVLARFHQANGSYELLADPGPTHNINRTCLSNGLLSGILPICVSVCSPLAVPANGTLSPAAKCSSNTSLEGTECSLSCATGMGVRGGMVATCQNNGTWSNANFYCEEEQQFLITNQDATPPVCLYVNSSLETHDPKYGYVYKIEETECNNNEDAIWTWFSSHQLQHVKSGSCLTVLDKNHKKFTPLIVRNCSSTADLSQQWYCAQLNSKLIELPKYDLFINFGDSDSDEAVAYRHLISKNFDNKEEWEGIDVFNSTVIAPLCSLHTNKCAPFPLPRDTEYSPSKCDGRMVIDIGEICEVHCKKDFIFRFIFNVNVTATCTSNRDWDYGAVTFALPLECKRPCLALTIDPSVSYSSDLCTNGSAFFGDVCEFSCTAPLQRIGSAYSICGLFGQWSDPSPTCTRVCTPLATPSAPANTSVINAIPVNCPISGDPYAPYILDGDTCEFKCDPMYIPTTTLTRRCLTNGNFDASYPTCVIPVAATYTESLCGVAPPHPQSVGKLSKEFTCTVPGNKSRKCAKYKCDPGYSFDLSDTTHCMANTYQWNSPPPCKRECLDISTSFCDNKVEGDTCRTTCYNTSSLSHGTSRIFCRADGTWSGTLAYCADKPVFRISTLKEVGGAKVHHCLMFNDAVGKDPSIILNQCPSWIPGSRSYLWSWEGPYLLRHVRTGMCLSTASLLHGARLILRECNLLDQLQQWKCSADARRPYIVNLRYEDHYVWASSSFLTDNATDVGARLAHVDDLPKLPDGTIDVTDIKLDYSWFSLNESLPGVEDHSLCASHHASTYLCPPLSAALPIGGATNPATCAELYADEGQECKFECLSGYALGNGSQTETECLVKGIWSTIQFACVPACTKLDAPEFGRLTCSNEPTPIEDSTCTYQCDTDFELIGQATRVCQWDGRWSGGGSYCAKRCQTLAMPNHATVTPLECYGNNIGILPGTICLYSCFEEFRITERASGTSTFDQSVTRTCFRNGTWSGNALTCARVCPAQNKPENGKIIPITCVTDYSVTGFECKVECNEGYAVYGNNIRTCGDQGVWENSVTDDLGPPCRTKCTSLPLVLNAQFTCYVSGTTTRSDSNVKGTSCSNQCFGGYGLTPGSPTQRKCQDDGIWSGEAANCAAESQFAIFLLRQSNGIDRPHVCLVANGKSEVIKIEASSCMEGSDMHHRWAWYDLKKLKNAATGLCLSVGELNAGEKLILTPCTDVSSPALDHWSCNGIVDDGRSWLLRVANTDLFPDYGYAYSSNFWLSRTDSIDLDEDDVHWYARSYINDGFTTLADSPPVTVCSRRPGQGICPPLKYPSNGIVHPHICVDSSEVRITAGTKCQFECGVGYRLKGGLHIVECQINGVWAGLVPKCLILCRSLPPVPHGRIYPVTCVEIDIDLEEEREKKEDGQYVGVLQDESCSIECDDGWLLVGGPPVLICLGSGEWNANQATCKRLCPRFSTPENAVALERACLVTEQTEGHVCSFRCNPGYGVPRAKSACENATTVLADSDVGERVCESNEDPEAEKRGYDIEIHLSCSSSGAWLGVDPICYPLCDALSHPENGVVEPKSCIEQAQVVGTICEYVCAPKHMIRGIEYNFTCIEGLWISTDSVNDVEFDIDIFKHGYEMKIPACDLFCPELVVENANRSTVVPPSCLMGKNPVGTECKIFCESDYVLKGNYRVTCLDDGKWNYDLGTCIKKCPALVAPPSGEIAPRVCTTAAMGDGAICTFSCFDKYALEGSLTTTCDGKGLWSFESPICQRRCFPLPRFYNGNAGPVASCFTEHISTGETCSFVCADEFLLTGSPILTCLVSGDWDQAPPTCNRICEAPVISHGSFKCVVRGKTVPGYLVAEEIPTWGSSCTVECDTQYAPSKNARFICRNDGRWRPEVPQCTRTGVPMYILQLLGNYAVCLIENEDKRTVVQRPQSECLKQTDFASSAAWRWLGKYNIQNARTGRCMYIRALGEGEILRTQPCDTEDVLQHWDCSIYNAFQLILRGTDFAPTTYYRNLGEIVIQRWSDSHSYYSTFDLVTLAHSSLCSRRPGAVCPPLTDIDGGKVEPPFECQSPDIEAGVQCNYVCDDNRIVVEGESYTTCMGNGIWSNPPPKCEGYCDPLETLPDSAYIPDVDCIFDPSPVGTVCKVVCTQGFDLNGNGTIVCLGHQTWSAINLKCFPICPALFGLLNGEVSPTPCRSNVCKFTCHPGYVLVGSDTGEISCKKGGRWSEVLPKCLRDAQFRIIAKESRNQRDVCLAVPEDSEESLIKAPCTPAEVHDGSQLFKWRKEGHHLHHPQSGKCLTGSLTRWSNVSLVGCYDFVPYQEWDCGTVPGLNDYSLHIKNRDAYLDTGAVVDVFAPSLNKSNSLLEVVIETDYYKTSQWVAMHYYARVSCQDTAACFRQAPNRRPSDPRNSVTQATVVIPLLMVECGGFGTVCSMKDLKQCPTFPKIENADVSPATCHDEKSITKGMICKVTCKSGYNIGQTDKAVCGAEGLWTTPLPTCTGVYQCPRLTTVDQSLIIAPTSCTSKSVTEGVTCYFACQQDHHLVGDTLIKCQTGGTWSGFVPTCRPQCGALHYVPGVVITPFSCHGINNDPGTVCKVSCSSNKRLWGSSERECRDDGSWSGDEAVCVTFCQAARPPSSGNVYPDRCTKDENYEENTCNFRCNVGFLLIGHTYVTCMDGQWDRPIPDCIPQALCLKVDGTDPGVKDVYYNKLIKGQSIGVGTSVTVICEDRFLLNKGLVTRTCLSNGQWEDGVPKCLASCPPLLPPNRGSMIPNHCGWKYQEAGGGCFVKCDPGWKLDSAPVVQCLTGGKWSGKVPTCIGGAKQNDAKPPFIIRQLHRLRDRHVCLRADRDTKLVVLSVECDLSSSIDKEFQWRWRDLDVGLVESIYIAGECWAPVRYKTVIRLGLKTCDRNDPSQHFECADVTLRQYALHIGTGNIWLGSMDEEELSTEYVHLVTAPQYYMLDWEAFSVADVTKSGGLQTSANMSSENTACMHMCGGVLTANEGTISSPGYPQKYPRNVICRWTISVPDTIIRLWISDIDIEPGRDGGNKDCNRDYLSIVEGENSTSDTSHSLATLCGRIFTTVGPITTMHGNLAITFKSDDHYSKKKGFNAKWLSTKPPNVLTDCHNTIRASSPKNLSSRLVGGKKEDIVKVPWQAALFGSNDGTSLCGAAIIHQRYVLTAAHCVDHIKTHEELQYMIIAFGSSDLWRLTRLVGRLRQFSVNLRMDDPEGTQAYRLRDLYLHPNYDDYLNHDVALIKTAADIKWSDTVYPACLPPADVSSSDLGWAGRIHLPKTYCKLAGWGSESDDGEIAGHLASIEVPVMSDQHCTLLSARTFGRRVNSNSTLCAGHFDGTRQSPCEGDEGGALVCEWNKNFYAVGIASQQLGSCTLLNAPRYFARVAAHRTWLDDQIRRAEIGMPSKLIWTKPPEDITGN